MYLSKILNSSIRKSIYIHLLNTQIRLKKATVFCFFNSHVFIVFSIEMFGLYFDFFKFKNSVKIKVFLFLTATIPWRSYFVMWQMLLLVLDWLIRYV